MNHTNDKKPTLAEIKKTTPFSDLAHLNVEQLAALAKFVRQVGGIKNARLAVDSLEELKQAA
jgi:hypothetical protein